MTRTHLLGLAALVTVVACDDARMPSSPSLREANTAPKSGAHFLAASAEMSVQDLVTSWKEAGLGEGNVTVRGDAIATAEYACLNNGAEFPDDKNKQQVTGAVSAEGTFDVGKNGRFDGSLALPAPATTLSCPPGQANVLVFVTYNAVSITDVTNQVTEPIAGSYGAVFYTDVP